MREQRPSAAFLGTCGSNVPPTHEATALRARFGRQNGLPDKLSGSPLIGWQWVLLVDLCAESVVLDAVALDDQLPVAQGLGRFDSLSADVVKCCRQRADVYLDGYVLGVAGVHDYMQVRIAHFLHGYRA